MKLSAAVALGSAFVLTTALVASVQGGEVTASCGTVTTPLNARMIYAGEKVGGVIRNLADGKPDRAATTEHTFGMWANVKNTLTSFAAASRGDERPAEAQKVASAAESAQAAALSSAGCTPTACQGLGGSSLAGAALAADALRKAGFPASEIPTFIAVANLESSFNPKAWNDYGAGMAGMWQLNQAYWKLDNWQDPYANAVMAKRVRDESVAKGDAPWQPWSTWRSAVRDASKYAKFGALTKSQVSVNNSDDAATTPDECPSGSVDARVVTWNTLKTNSIPRILSGLDTLTKQADVIALQEVFRPSLVSAISRHLPGWGMVGESTGHPVLFNTARFDMDATYAKVIISRKDKMEARFDGRHWNGRRGVVSVTLRDQRSGSVFSVVNTHQIPTIQRGNGYNPATPKRTAAARRLMSAVMGRVSDLKPIGPVIVTGDMNGGFDPDGMWKKAGLRTSYQVLKDRLKTHGNGTLDYVMSVGADPVAQKVVGTFGSDHRAVLVTFKAQEKGTADAVTPAGWDMPGNRTVDQAVEFMTSMARDQTPIPSGRCLHYVALAYGHSTTAQQFGRYWARDVFTAMPSRYRTAGRSDPPRGALVFWNTGGPGHIAISLGGGKVASTDYPRSGVIGIAPIEEIDRWGERIGWTWPVFEGRTQVG